jgi:hypothetical protein
MSKVDTHEKQKFSQNGFGSVSAFFYFQDSNEPFTFPTKAEAKILQLVLYKRNK